MKTPQAIAIDRRNQMFSKLDGPTKWMNVELFALKMPGSVAAYMNHGGQNRIDGMLLLCLDLLDFCSCGTIKVPDGNPRNCGVLQFDKQPGHGMLEEVAALCVFVGQRKTGVINSAEFYERAEVHVKKLAAYMHTAIQSLNKHDTFITFCNQAWENSKS